MEELFIMSNANTLLALSYIRTTDNPLVVVCNLIEYTLYLSSEKELRFDVLKCRLTERFGINFPNHVIESCASYLVKNKSLEKLPNGGGYRLLKSNFNVELFEQEKIRLTESEKIFIQSMLDYLKDSFGLIWNRDEAYKYLTNLLLSESITEAVVEQDLNAENILKHVQPEWYVKKFILKISEDKISPNYKYFSDVFNGKIVLNGLTQMSDYNRDREQKFRGTSFYFDTKILLRILGYSFPFYVETARELLMLIKNEYKGEVCVPKHIVDEIKYALNLAKNDMISKGYVINREINFFQRQSNYNAEDFKIAIDSVEASLKNNYGCKVLDDIDWNLMQTQKNCIDTTELERYIKSNNPVWNERAIKNDVRTILLVNIRREGNYSLKFGGKKKLPIFITSNTKLIKDVRTYTAEYADKDNVDWTIYNLPLMSDYDLTCRLWVTSKEKAPISLNLFKAAFLYQQSDEAFYQKVMGTYSSVKEKHQYNIIDLDHERFEKLKDMIIENTGGNFDEIDDNIVALSFEELASRESREKDATINLLSQEGNEKSHRIDTLTQDLIKSYSKPFVNKVGFRSNLVVFLIKNASFIFAIIGVITIYAVDYLISNEFVSKSKLWIFIPIILSIIFEFIDKKVTDNSILLSLEKKYKQHAKKQYIKKIKNKLQPEERKYMDLIVNYCIENTLFFSNN